MFRRLLTAGLAALAVLAQPAPVEADELGPGSLVEAKAILEVLGGPASWMALNRLKSQFQPGSYRDEDGDGIVRSRDLCPLQREDFDGVHDEDGCPERDGDGDGFADEWDLCPLEAEDIRVWQGADGCPDRWEIPELVLLAPPPPVETEATAPAVTVQNKPPVAPSPRPPVRTTTARTTTTLATVAAPAREALTRDARPASRTQQGGWRRVEATQLFGDEALPVVIPAWQRGAVDAAPADNQEPHDVGCECARCRAAGVLPPPATWGPIPRAR